MHTVHSSLDVRYPPTGQQVDRGTLKSSQWLESAWKGTKEVGSPESKQSIGSKMHLCFGSEGAAASHPKADFTSLGLGESHSPDIGTGI